ncbi:MAG: hemolysin family protein [Lachnospiraceae bacterium]|nr:hemolysin family protein [Lachnospiraceae bacterium]
MKWAVLVLLLLLSAFFSSAETALMASSRIRIRALSEQGNKKAEKLLHILDHSPRMLTTILVGNNIVNLAASALATTIAMQISLNVGIMTALLTLVLLVFGEITPKNAAAANSEKLAMAYAGVVAVLMIVLSPLIWVIDGICRIVARLLKIPLDREGGGLTEGELRTIVEVGHEDGVIETEEKQMIKNVFDFGDSRAKDIMIPRIDVVEINMEEDYATVRELFEHEKYTRIPVYKDDTDNVIGIINLKDFFHVTDPEGFRIKDIMRDAYYTFEMKKTSDLMMEMRKESVSIAIVLNEYGAAEGIVTMEDLIEEIVGEIRDEYDEDENALIISLGTREYEVEASLKLDDVNDAIGTSLTSEDFDSLGGYMIGLLDRLPEKGETAVDENGIAFTAVSMSKNRIERIRVELPERGEEKKNAVENTNL